MYRKTLVTVSLALTIAPAAMGQAPFVFERRYQADQEFSYHVEDRRRQQAGESVSTTIASAESSHRVAFEGGVPFETVRWTEAVDLATGQHRTDLDSLPISRLSLHPNGPIEPGKPAGDPLMIGMITDLVTLYVAVSPKVGIANLHLPGDQAAAPAPVFGDFADGSTFIAGQNKFRVDVAMTALSPELVEYATYMQPLGFDSGELHRDFMQQPACVSAPNNIQYVRAQGADFLAAWGCESITIQTKIDRQSGIIVESLMVSYLLQNVKTCQDAALTQCADAPPIEENRTVELKLLDHETSPQRSFVPPRQRP
jgi:hypothetical protein